MTKLQKKIIGFISIIGLLAVGVVGTYAYLTAKTEPIKNVFTVGNVDISLSEPSWDPKEEHKIIPGVALSKDPTVTVKADSEESYVFIKVKFDANFVELKEKYSLDYSADWTRVATKDNEVVYGYKTTVPSAKANTVLTPLFKKITFSSELTKEELAKLAGEKIEVTGYAIQANGFANAAEAWAELSK